MAAKAELLSTERALLAALAATALTTVTAVAVAERLVILGLVVPVVIALLILLFRVVFKMALLDLVAAAVALQHTQMAVVQVLVAKAEVARVALQIIAADLVTGGMAKADRVELLEFPPKVETMVAGGMEMADPVEMAWFVSFIPAQRDTGLQIHKCRML
jgi:hypothetical protein